MGTHVSVPTPFVVCRNLSANPLQNTVAPGLNRRLPDPRTGRLAVCSTACYRRADQLTRLHVPYIETLKKTEEVSFENPDRHLLSSRVSSTTRDPISVRAQRRVADRQTAEHRRRHSSPLQPQLGSVRLLSSPKKGLCMHGSGCSRGVSSVMASPNQFDVGKRVWTVVGTM